LRDTLRTPVRRWNRHSPLQQKTSLAAR